VQFVPNYFAQPTGKKGKEKAHGKSNRDYFRPKKWNLPHYDALQAKKRPGGSTFTA
jgi:hypothetical protein